MLEITRQLVKAQVHLYLLWAAVHHSSVPEIESGVLSESIGLESLFNHSVSNDLLTEQVRLSTLQKDVITPSSAQANRFLRWKEAHKKMK